jgi:hypothetical protein
MGIYNNGNNHNDIFRLFQQINIILGYHIFQKCDIATFVFILHLNNPDVVLLYFAQH